MLVRPRSSSRALHRQVAPVVLDAAWRTAPRCRTRGSGRRRSRAARPPSPARAARSSSGSSACSPGRRSSPSGRPRASCAPGSGTPPRRTSPAARRAYDSVTTVSRASAPPPGCSSSGPTSRSSGSLRLGQHLRRLDVAPLLQLAAEAIEVGDHARLGAARVVAQRLREDHDAAPDVRRGCGRRAGSTAARPSSRMNAAGWKKPGEAGRHVVARRDQRHGQTGQAQDDVHSLPAFYVAILLAEALQRFEHGQVVGVDAQRLLPGLAREVLVAPAARRASPSSTGCARRRGTADPARPAPPAPARIAGCDTAPSRARASAGSSPWPTAACRRPACATARACSAVFASPSSRAASPRSPPAVLQAFPSSLRRRLGLARLGARRGFALLRGSRDRRRSSSPCRPRSRVAGLPDSGTLTS